MDSSWILFFTFFALLTVGKIEQSKIDGINRLSFWFLSIFLVKWQNNFFAGNFSRENIKKNFLWAIFDGKTEKKIPTILRGETNFLRTIFWAISKINFFLRPFFEKKRQENSFLETFSKNKGEKNFFWATFRAKRMKNNSFVQFLEKNYE